MHISHRQCDTGVTIFSKTLSENDNDFFVNPYADSDSFLAITACTLNVHRDPQMFSKLIDNVKYIPIN